MPRGNPVPISFSVPVAAFALNILCNLSGPTNHSYELEKDSSMIIQSFKPSSPRPWSFLCERGLGVSMAESEIPSLQKPLGVQHKVRSSALGKKSLGWIFGEKQTKIGFLAKNKQTKTGKDSKHPLTYMSCVLWMCETASVISEKTDIQMIHRAPPLKKENM